MKLSKATVYVFACLQGGVVLVGLVAAAYTPADERSKSIPQKQQGPLIQSLKGVDLFRAYCASCHGTDGKGNGPVAPALNTKVPDLTTIAQRNGGMFPLGRVRKIIAGDEAVVAHGTTEMPVWGPIFHKVEEDRDYGEVRLQNVAGYLASIQQK